MAEAGKFVIRPKVRFCQWKDDDEDQEHDINKGISLPPKKPLIKSIVPVEKPYKIISLDDTLTLNNSSEEENVHFFKDRFENEKNIYDHDKKQLHDYDGNELLTRSLKNFSPPPITEKGSSAEFPFPKGHEFNDDQSPFIDSSFSLKEDMFENPKVVEVEVHAEDLSDSKISNRSKALSQETQTVYSLEENILNKHEVFDETKIDVKSQEERNLSAIQEESLEFEIAPEENFSEPEPLKIQKEMKLVTKKSSQQKSPSKTLKSTSPIKRQLNSVNRLSKPIKSPKKTVSRDSSKNQKLLSINSKIRTRPLGFIQRSTTKPKVSGVMPCLKARMASKVKSSPVKKTVIRNVAKSTKVSVEPGVPRVRKELKVDFENESKINLQFINREKLSKPEYNSIICTINKLKEVQKENIVTDVEHLPPIYKNLVNGKVTNSLDFAPDEAIFKNLINLSIDETQFPTRITRSKDPEPRHRDAVPKLSDFFITKYANEYCTAVYTKPKSPEPVERWSAFKVFDKIRSWKWNMDFVH